MSPIVFFNYGVLILLGIVVAGCHNNDINRSWSLAEMEHDPIKQVEILCKLCRHESEVDKSVDRINSIFKQLDKDKKDMPTLDCHLKLGEYLIEIGNNKLLLCYYFNTKGNAAAWEMVPRRVYQYAQQYPEKFFALNEAKLLLACIYNESEEDNKHIDFIIDDVVDGSRGNGLKIATAFRQYASKKNVPNWALALEYAEKIVEHSQQLK